MSDKKISRIELQQAMGNEVTTSVDKALKQFNLDPADPDANRRAFRAVVTLAAQKLFDLGCPPQVIAQQAFEAVVAEHKYRTEKAINAGQPFGLVKPAEA